jgi:tetratricopeptide (TPR) repeat protein
MSFRRWGWGSGKTVSTSSAAHVIAGFRYQLLHSVSALIALRDDEELLLEVSEDFTIVAQDGTTDVQVKNSQAARGPRSFSLESPEVASVLQRYWETSNGGTLRRRLIFLARGGAAIERDYSFPGGAPGLIYWRAAALGADTKSFRSALIDILSGTPLGHWLASNPDDAELRSRFLNPIQWELGSISATELGLQLRDQVSELYHARNLPVIAASQAVKSLTDLAFETASRPNVQDRALKKLDAIRVMDEVAASLLLSQALAAPPQPLDSSSHGLLVSELEALPPSIAQRDATIQDLLTKTIGQSLIWIHGANGVGKSTLARLVAQRLGGRWIYLDLQPVQKTSSSSLAAWRELTRMIALTAQADGIIVDDFDHEAAVALRSRFSALTRMLGARGARMIVTSHHEPTPGILLDCGSSASSSIQAPYFGDADVTELIKKIPAPAKEMVPAWSAFLRISTGGGHPLLVAAKISSLRARSWPNEALAEDIIGGPSDAVRLSRDEARRTLLRDLAELDQARSLDAGSLLRRIGSVFDRVEDGLVRELAIADPSLPNGGDALAVLRGTWLEPMVGGDLRISPLLTDIVSDVPPEQATNWRLIAAEYWLQKRTLDARTLPLCFWNAFLSDHTGVLMTLCTTIVSMPKDRLRGAAALLSPMTALAMDKPLSSNPAVATHLRLLQFDVADAVEERALAGAIARRFMEEVAEVGHADLHAMMVHIATSKFLMAEFAEIPPADRISYALALRDAERRTIELGAGEFTDPTTLIPLKFKTGTDTADLLFSMIVQHIESADDELKAFQALDAVAANIRNGFLEAMSAIYEGQAVFVHCGWARDQGEERDMTVALEKYDEIEVIAKNWGRSDVLYEVVCARSIILDESLKRFDDAISVVDKAMLRNPNVPALIRQKSKVLGHAGRDREAIDLLIQVEDDVGKGSPFDRSLALRDGALSAAKSNKFDDALRLLDKALASMAFVEGREALTAGILIERSLVLWHAGKHERALVSAADTLDAVERFSLNDSRQAERSHQYARAIIGLFLSDLDEKKRHKTPPFSFGHASALQSENAQLVGLDLKPLPDNWRILALVEARIGADAGIKIRSMEKQSNSFLGTTELLIRQALYEKALQSRDINEALRKGCHVAWATKVIAGAPRDSDNLPRVAASDLIEPELELMLSDASMHEMIQGVVLDVIVHRVVSGQDLDTEFFNTLRRSADVILGRNRALNSIVDAASGNADVRDTELTSAVYAAAVAISEKAADSNLSVRFYRDMMTLGHITKSFVNGVLSSSFAPRMALGWRHVLDDQQFMLRSPASNVPAIEAALKRMQEPNLAGAARLLLAAEPAVGYRYGEGWREFLGRIATSEV